MQRATMEDSEAIAKKAFRYIMSTITKLIFHLGVWLINLLESIVLSSLLQVLNKFVHESL